VAHDVLITVTDPLWPGDELRYHPGEVNLRRADIVVVNKVDVAEPAGVEAVLASVAQTNPGATVVQAASPVSLDAGPPLDGARVLVVENGGVATLRAMLLTPRYGEPSILRFDLDLGDPSIPLLRQRRRLATLLGGLDEEQWAAASRCEGWSVQDVIAHLVSTNQFWAFSIGAGLAGEPTRFLATFDPVATPAELVASVRSQSPADVLERFVATNEAVADVVADLDDDGWSTIGEAPPGHVPLRAVALHALWDSWVHERDVVLPLGLEPVEEPDEIIGCLGYGAALSPAFTVSRGGERQGAISVEATDPDARFVVEVGESVIVRAGDVPDDALRLTGPAVALAEALSFRVPLPCPVADDHQWLLSGLAEAFDRSDSGSRV